MLATLDAEGTLRSRPLHTLEADPEGRLWFFISASSPKIDELQRARMTGNKDAIGDNRKVRLA